MSNTTTRREVLVQSMAVVGAGSLVTGVQPRTHAAAHASADRVSPTVRYCLNTSTIRGQEIPVDREILLAAAAGYDSVELWIREIRQFMEDGGTISSTTLEFPMDFSL